MTLNVKRGKGGEKLDGICQKPAKSLNRSQPIAQVIHQPLNG